METRPELQAMWEPEGTQWLGWELPLASQWAGKRRCAGEATLELTLPNHPGLLREECGRRGVSSYAQEVASLALFRKVELLGEDENVGILTGASSLRSIVF